MKIWSQKAWHITNIESLNWNLNLLWNTFNSSIQLDKNKKEIFDLMSEFEKKLIDSWKITSWITQSSLELKEKLNKNSSDGVVESFKDYAKKIKDITDTTEWLSETATKLLDMWWSLWKFITLLL